MNNYYPLISKVFILFYTAFSLATLSNCAKENEEHSALEQINNTRSVKLDVLIDQFDAVQFNCNEVNSILNKNVVLDTLLIGVQKHKDNYVLKVKVNCGLTEKIFAELKCTKEIYHQYQKTKSNNLLIAAKISSFIKTDLMADVDTLTDKLKQVNLGSSILLSGECLALLENAYYDNTN